MSLSIVIGGSASGKSAYAEQLVRELTKTRSGIYLATMQSAGREAQARIAKHRAMREDLGLTTVECERGLESVQVPADSCVLLEDLGNLTANVLYGGEESGAVEPAGEEPEAARTPEAAEEILRQVESLRARCAHLIVVTNEVFSGGSGYAGDTDRYLQVLGRVNRELAAEADRIVEVVSAEALVHERENGGWTVRRLLKGGRGKGETSMMFVTGPLASGKQDYVMRVFGWDEAAFAENAVRDVQDLAAQAVREALTQRAEDGQNRIHSVREGAGGSEKSGDPGFGNPDRGHIVPDVSLEDRLRRLADDLAQKQVVIATEVGGGIVPLDPLERREREAAGRLACMLAERAQTVVRVFCGLPQTLKGSQMLEIESDKNAR